MRLLSFHGLCFANKYKIALCYYFSLFLVLVLSSSNVSICSESLEVSSSVRKSQWMTEEAWESSLGLQLIDSLVSISGTIMTPSGGDPMNLGLKITTSRISDECLITAPLWATTARGPRTITALSTQTNWGSINSPYPRCTPQSQILARPLLRNLLTIPSHPWIIGLLWRDH